MEEVDPADAGQVPDNSWVERLVQHCKTGDPDLLGSSGAAGLRASALIRGIGSTGTSWAKCTKALEAWGEKLGLHRLVDDGSNEKIWPSTIYEAPECRSRDELLDMVLLTVGEVPNIDFMTFLELVEMTVIQEMALCSPPVYEPQTPPPPLHQAQLRRHQTLLQDRLQRN
jgi:hypothetical protein